MRRTHNRAGRFAMLVLAWLGLALPGWGAEQGSLANTTFHFPSWEQLVRVLSLSDYNTRVVVIGTTLLGMASGIVGSFMFLRKRALMGDAASHATLPGIGIAFLVMTACGGTGKYVPGLLLGALVSALIGVGFILLITRLTHLKQDAALGIILSVFFGFGVVISVVIQGMSQGHAAGLDSFIYGKTASMIRSDAWLIGISALVIVLLSILLFKELTLLCFDQEFAATEGWPVTMLDVTIMAMVVVVTVIGLQAVGLILMVALLIIPPAAARFWTHDLKQMVFLSAVIGAVSGLWGAAMSALIPRLPAGAIIVLVASTVFLVSLLFGTAQGAVFRAREHWLLRRKVSRQHLMRAMYEWFEHWQGTKMGISQGALLAARSWSARQLKGALKRAIRDGYAYEGGGGSYHLTEEGWAEARRIVRNHRLWEIYLITHADIAPSHVDRDADQLEHILGRSMVDKLEKELEVQYPEKPVPPSPHELGTENAPA